MRKIILSFAAAGAALVAASPAVAQYYPQPVPGYGYGQGNWGEVRALHGRIDNIERQINGLDRQGRLNDWRADRLRDQAHGLEQRLRYAGRDGLNPYEARDIQIGIERLEQQVRYSASYRWDHDGRGERNDRWGDRD